MLLNNNEIDDSQFTQSILENIAKIKTLKKIEIKYNSISDVKIIEKFNKNKIKFDVVGNNIDLKETFPPINYKEIVSFDDLNYYCEQLKTRFKKD